MEIEAPVRPPAQAAAAAVPGVSYAPILIAYCNEDGVINVGDAVPAHRIELLRGPVLQLHDRLNQHARQREVEGRLRFVVPGMPEALNVFLGKVAARSWIDWCSAFEDDERVVWNRSLRVDA